MESNMFNYEELALLVSAKAVSKGVPRTELVSMAGTCMAEFYWSDLPAWEYRIDTLVLCGYLTRSSPGHVEITAKGRDAAEDGLGQLKSYLNNITADWELVA
jgi:hypothetical protein